MAPMQGIFGWTGWDADAERRDAAARAMDAAVAGFPGAALTAAGEAACIAGLTGHGADRIACEDGIVVVVCGRPAWHGRGGTPTSDRAIAPELLRRYREAGRAALQDLGGAFALAVIDTRRQETLLAVDRMGILPLFYTTRDRCLVFGSTPDAVGAHPRAGKTPDLQQLFNYGYFHMVPSPGAVYRDFHRLPPGHCLVFAGGTARVEAYWRPVFHEHEHRDQRALKEEFLATLRRCVRRAVDGGDAVGAFLSGGTDSSTITGILGEVAGPGARTYSIGFDAEGYDEMEYARIAAKHFHTDHHEYYVTPDDVVRAIPLIAQAYDQPYGNSSAIPTYYCSLLARDDGVGVLLGGDGGDELFGGNARYAKQQVFEVYGRLPRPLRRRVIEPLLNAAPDGVKHLGPLRKLHSYVTQAAIPMPQRVESYNLVHRLGPAAMFTADFLAAVDTDEPGRLLERVYHQAKAQHVVNRMLALDFDFTLADNDLPKVTRMAWLAGVEARFPMLDDELVEFSLRLEPRLKVRGTQLRYFFKESLRGFLPDAIITKSKHGFGLPFGPWLRTHKPLQALVFDSLAGLKERRIFRADFIDRCTDTYLHNHPAYYGAMVWVMMMLELWFQHHVDTAGDGRPAPSARSRHTSV